MIAPARVAAYETLSAVSAGNADLPTAIAFARDNLRDDRDRALAAEIATGVSTLVSDTSDTSAEPHISEIQAEGKRPMTTRDFLAGHRLSRGDRFTATP